MNQEIIEENKDASVEEYILHVSVSQVVVNPYQPRRHFANEELEELSLSIKTVGLIHPPLVRPLDDGVSFELVSGERRFRAAQLAGMEVIPVVVRKSSHEISAQAALIENIQRVELNPIEVAKALRQLENEFGFQQEELATRLGKKRSSVSNYLRLLGLPKNIQDSVSSGMISMGHAKAILSLEGFEKQNLLHELVLRDELTVREAEEASLRIAQKAKKHKLAYVNRDFYLEAIAERIQERLGTKVSIQSMGKRGRISINYYSLDDLERLLAIFGVDEKK